MEIDELTAIQKFRTKNFPTVRQTLKTTCGVTKYDHKNDNVFFVKPSYLINKWRHFIKVPTYHECQTSKCTTPCIWNT